MEELEEDVITSDKDAEIKGKEAEIGELLKTKDRTPEQQEELEALRKERKDLIQERMNELTKARRQAERELAREREEKEVLRKQLEEREEERARPAASGKDEFITINGRKFYTDRSLASKVQAGEMTQDEAWQHQQERIEEKAFARMKEEKGKEDVEEIRRDTVKGVLKEYPHFNPKHPDHNPNDPLYKEASRLLDNGYNGNPRGVRLAIEDAKRILGLDSKRPDLSDELSVTNDNLSGTDSRKEKRVELSEFEQEQAVRLYVFGGRTNPATGRIYTKKEAIEKAMKAKKDRESYNKR